MRKPVCERPAADAGFIEAGVAVGRNEAFGPSAGRSAAAQAPAIQRLREEELFQRCASSREDFCPRLHEPRRVRPDRHPARQRRSTSSFGVFRTIYECFPGRVVLPYLW